METIQLFFRSSFDKLSIEYYIADVKWLLDNSNEAEIIARRGYYTVRKYDTWDCGFEKVVETMRKVLCERNNMTVF